MKLSEFIQTFFGAGGGFLAANTNPEVEFFLNNNRVELTSIECTVTFPDVDFKRGSLSELGDPGITININFEGDHVQDI